VPSATPDLLIFERLKKIGKLTIFADQISIVALAIRSRPLTEGVVEQVKAGAAEGAVAIKAHLF
jgi:hypothetical protein